MHHWYINMRNNFILQVFLFTFISYILFEGVFLEKFPLLHIIISNSFIDHSRLKNIYVTWYHSRSDHLFLFVDSFLTASACHFSIYTRICVFSCPNWSFRYFTIGSEFCLCFTYMNILEVNLKFFILNQRHF